MSPTHLRRCRVRWGGGCPPSSSSSDAAEEPPSNPSISSSKLTPASLPFATCWRRVRGSGHEACKGILYRPLPSPSLRSHRCPACPHLSAAATPRRGLSKLTSEQGLPPCPWPPPQPPQPLGPSAFLVYRSSAPKSYLANNPWPEWWLRNRRCEVRTEKTQSSQADAGAPFVQKPPVTELEGDQARRD